MKRRAFIKWATAFPLLAQVGWQQAMGNGWAEVSRNATDNIYTRLGKERLPSTSSTSSICKLPLAVVSPNSQAPSRA
jgi:hypothetical protein